MVWTFPRKPEREAFPGFARHRDDRQDSEVFLGVLGSVCFLPQRGQAGQRIPQNLGEHQEEESGKTREGPSSEEMATVGGGEGHARLGASAYAPVLGGYSHQGLALRSVALSSPGVAAGGRPESGDPR